MHNLTSNQAEKIYFPHQPMPDNQVLEKAADILAERYVRNAKFCSTQATKDYLLFKLGQHEREVFAVMMLDNQHQLIEYQELFFGTINAASVYPREVVKAVLYANAATVILAHNHPSGIPEPSPSDIAITKKLSDALGLIDVQVLDHIIVGETAFSFAERGLL